MTNNKDTASFFENGTTEQFEYCFKLYPEVLKLRAEKRNKKPQELIRLDQWYQNELPKLIKARGKDAHMVYDELVQTMKWKQSRGKFYPQLSYLVKVNTPRAVMQETKKAFRKLPNLEQAITALSNLKGVGTTMASALLAAAAPDSAPFMADECLMAIPEIEGIDYTTKEYLNFVQHIQATVERLNIEAGATEKPVWSPHRVELALWAHYVANDINPELLDQMPTSGSKGSTANGDSKIQISSGTAEESAGNEEDTNDGEDTNESLAEATRSETDNENTNPSIVIKNSSNMATSVGVIAQDGDSNFVSNDSTSQEAANNIIDDNTTQTTATTSTDDGDVANMMNQVNTPLASDSESNLEAPTIKATTVAGNDNANDTKLSSTQTTTTPINLAVATPVITAAVKSNDEKDLICKDKVTESSSDAKIQEEKTTNIIKPTLDAEHTALGNGNGNGNGTLLVAGVGDSLDGENSSSCLRSSVNEDLASEEYDESSNSNSRLATHNLDNSSGGASSSIAFKAMTPVANMNDTTNTTNITDTESTLSSAAGLVGQKRSLVQNVDDAANIEQPEMKKVRSDEGASLKE